MRLSSDNNSGNVNPRQESLRSFTFLRLCGYIIGTLLYAFHADAQPFGIRTPASLTCKESDTYILTHLLTPAGPLPTVFDPNGVYPYVSYSETSNRPVVKKYKVIELENDYLSVTICPDLGGKILSIIHKPSKKEVLYVPNVIRPTRILPRFYFVAGGIEVSFPIAHSPSQNEKVLYKIDSTAERIYVTCGERELRFGMQWSVEYSLGIVDKFLTQRVIYHNPGTQAYPWMSWSNAALPSAADTKFDFPDGNVLAHSSKLDSFNWKKQGPKTESDIQEMTGYFWKTKNVNAFGAFTPSLGIGLYHIADNKETPGIKLWSYGRGDDSAWATLSTEKHQPYIEIQAGPAGDQSIKQELQPKETKWHEEFWFPTNEALDIRELKVPRVSLRPLKEIPLFGWARPGDVDVWINFLNAWKANGPLPPLPDDMEDPWPPSGMEELGSAFSWAISYPLIDTVEYEKISKEKRYRHAFLLESWTYHYGVWLAGRGHIDSAIQLLERSINALGHILSARLYRAKGDYRSAYRKFNFMGDELRYPSKPQWFHLHPQVVVERDKTLRGLGTHTLTQREKLLDKVNALKDEWIIERRVQLLIDKGEYQKAKDLLLSTNFQKVHQTYTRTGLWKQICSKLNIPCEPIPASLGEDRLATFGAYREYE